MTARSESAMTLGQLADRIVQVDEFLRQQAAHAVNCMLTARNWFIGFYIVEFEQHGADRAQYGEQLLKTLAKQINRKGMTWRRLTNTAHSTMSIRNSRERSLVISRARCRSQQNCFPRNCGHCLQYSKILKIRKYKYCDRWPQYLSSHGRLPRIDSFIASATPVFRCLAKSTIHSSAPSMSSSSSKVVGQHANSTAKSPASITSGQRSPRTKPLYSATSSRRPNPWSPVTSFATP